MKTPDEIKKGLECRIRGLNEKCEFRCDMCDVYISGYKLEDRYSDALAYIQQLEADKAAWEDVAASPGAVEDMARENYRLTERLAQVERELAAAVVDIRKCAKGEGIKCTFCKHTHSPEKKRICGRCFWGSNFEWRGVCEEGGAQDAGEAR